MRNALLIILSVICITACRNDPEQAENQATAESRKIPVIMDTDANNELDDQHAIAYLLFSQDVFDVKGITVNATSSGGDIGQHYLEAQRIIRLCDASDIPLLKGADADYKNIAPTLDQDNYDGKSAVDFIVNTARKMEDRKLVLLPVGKLTNIALALEQAPDIKDKVRIVWLGSNYPEPGEYNQNNDTTAMNYILNTDVPFEIVTVRYGRPDGSDAVRITPEEVDNKLKGRGPEVAPVTGRHGGKFTRFGDYSVSLFSKIDLYGDPPSRALFDLVAVAVVKNTEWGEQQRIPAPVLQDNEWVERPENSRTITIWENFNRQAILNDLYSVIPAGE